MAYGNFKSHSRAARRGNILEWKGAGGIIVQLRPVKSQKGGVVRTCGKTQSVRNWKGAYYPALGALGEAALANNHNRLTRY